MCLTGLGVFCCFYVVNPCITANLLPNLSDLTHTYSELEAGFAWTNEVDMYLVTKLCAQLRFCYFRVHYFNVQIEHRSFHHFITFNYSNDHLNMESCYQMLLTN